MFETLIHFYSTNLPRAIGITVACLVILAGLVWVSIIDIKKQSITFWKMLIASGAIIIVPLFVSFFYNCEGLKDLKWHLIFAIPAWFFLLYVNIMINKDKFMGKADIDLLTAILAVGAMYSLWLKHTVEPMAVLIRITGFWYQALSFLLMGAGVYLIVFLVLVFTKMKKKKLTVKEMVKETKISVIPMFIPVSVMVPYIIMVS